MRAPNDFYEEDEGIELEELMDILAGEPDGVTERPASAGLGEVEVCGDNPARGRIGGVSVCVPGGG